MSRDTGTEFLQAEMYSLSSSAADGSTEILGGQRIKMNLCKKLPCHTALERVMAFVLVFLFVVCVIVTAQLLVNRDKDKTLVEEKKKTPFLDELCSGSEEAKQAGLLEFMKKVQKTYYKYSYFHSIFDGDVSMESSLPVMNITPAFLKERTDLALSLLEEFKKINYDELKLKPRETKAVYQVKQFLRSTFASPYDMNFYGGEWMLGPNYFCWQPFCRISAFFEMHAYSMKPKNLQEFETFLHFIHAYGDTVKQYQENMKLGVKSGMVRSIFGCQTGLNSFKMRFRVLTKHDNPRDILKEKFVQNIRSNDFIEQLFPEARTKWLKDKGKHISESIDVALVEGFGRPVIQFVKYLRNDHIRHCLPEEHSSGLAGLPVDYIYVDGKPTSTRTHKVLPITGENLNGKKAYTIILPYFTTSNITPGKIYEIGKNALTFLYPQAVKIARIVTGKSDNKTAIKEFKKILNAQDQFFNEEPFPVNESDSAAFKNCADKQSAQVNCPKRWEAFLKWSNSYHQILGLLSPKLTQSFYHTGRKISIPNCPLEINPNFNPHVAAQSFKRSDAGCSWPASVNVPFFLDNFGPKFSDWTTVAHEGWPGHHTQIQGKEEYFLDKCGDVFHWLDLMSDNSFNKEGWAVYAENPVVSEDTDAYHNRPLERYGMLKWQIWRALRLIVDTGIHYRGMKRKEALALFSKYAWEDGDLAVKEVTRYQGLPGQATAYLLGQRKIIKLREYCKKQLGNSFDIQDFHYQILSTGSAPEEYVDKHIKRYVECVLNDFDKQICDYIVHPMAKYHSQSSTAYGNVQFDRQYSTLAYM